jgi:hypothetical protein
MTTTHIKPADIVTIHRLREQGLTHIEIAQQSDIPISQVKSVYKYLPNYLLGRAKHQQRKRENYLEAVRLIKQERRAHKELPQQPAQTPQSHQSGSHFTVLKEAYAAFEKAAQAFVQAELATKQTGLFKENEELKAEVERLRGETGRLQQRSWIDELAGEEAI